MARRKTTAWQRTASSGRGSIGYLRFTSMIAVATAVIYALMYLNVLESTHIEFSQIRLWRALIMGCATGLVVLAFIWPLLPSARSRLLIVACAIAAMLPATWLLRSQRTVDDVAYLRAMIPNHSVAVLSSTRARIHDERVRELADEIIERQSREIDDMKALIATLERRPRRGSSPVLPPPAERAIHLSGRRTTSR